MRRFETRLVAGGKPPYDTWTFVLIPPDVAAPWGPGGRHAVRGTLAGAPFRGWVTRGEGVLRMPVPRPLRDAAGCAAGDVVSVEIEPDPETREPVIPTELQDVLDGDAELAAAFDALPPSHRRAWAEYVGQAKREATRVRRAAKVPDGVRTRSFPR